MYPTLKCDVPSAKSELLEYMLNLEELGQQITEAMTCCHVSTRAPRQPLFWALA